jgi:hypothetical protein
MPYKSEAQRRFFHSAGAKKAGISSRVVKEFDNASKGQHVPEHMSDRKRLHEFVKDKVRSKR